MPAFLLKNYAQGLDGIYEAFAIQSSMVYRLFSQVSWLIL